MNQVSFPQLLDQSRCLLGEGAVIERLNRNQGVELDPILVNSAFVYDETKRAAVEDIYREYLDIGLHYDLPLFLSTPTWRASRERIAQSDFSDRDVNADNYRFLNDMRKRYGDYARKIVISGLLSCRGDAYDPSQALDAKDSREFHSWQAAMLAEAGVDVLLSATLPALSEAIGLAGAMSVTGKPYLVSFVLRPEGTLLDGTPLKEAIPEIDAAFNPKPLAYMINCTHASIFRSGLQDKKNASSTARARIIGLLANTAALTPEELNNSEVLQEEPPEIFGKSLADLHDDFGIKILGGCCGTDDRHIRHLAARLAANGS